MKKYLPCHYPAIMARFWPKSCHFCPFLSLSNHFFGCHGHKYAYFRNRSHMHLPWTYTKLVWSSFGLCHASIMNTGGSKKGDFWVKIRSQWQGRSGAGIHCGNSLAPQITSILIGKHGLGPFWPLPSFPRVHGGSKMADFEVKIRSQWQGQPGTLESTWKLLNASNHIYINGKTWYRAAMTLAILLPCARGDQKRLILRSKLGYNGRVSQWAWNQRGNSLSPRIISILIRKHDLGPLWPLPSFSRGHRGSKMADFR